MEYAHLQKIKDMLGITGSYQDAALNAYVDEVIAYMVDAGVRQDVAADAGAAGVVARGVSDLWNYGSGGTKLSAYFKERVVQLAYGKGTDEEKRE